MLAHHRLSSSLRTCLRPFPRPLASTSKANQPRWIASSPPHKYAGPPGPILAENEFSDVDEDLLSDPELTGETAGDSKPTSYRDFMQNIGSKFRYAEPLTYLGETVEFVFSNMFCDSN